MDQQVVQRIEQSIDERGWGIVRTRFGRNGVPYSYTVGLQRSFSHPELLVGGASPAATRDILQEVVKGIRGGHWSLLDGEVDLVTAPRSQAFRMSPPNMADYCPLASRYSSMVQPGFQIFIRDTGGRHLWEPGYTGFAVPVLACVH